MASRSWGPAGVDGVPAISARWVVLAMGTGGQRSVTNQTSSEPHAAGLRRALCWPGPRGRAPTQCVCLALSFCAPWGLTRCSGPWVRLPLVPAAGKG